MAVYKISYFSKALIKNTEVMMIVPNDLRPGEEKGNPAYDREMKTLYLLHGFSGSCGDWLQRTKILDVAVKYNLAVVMPTGDNSFYLNGTGTGRAYETFVGRELVQYVQKTFHLSEKKEDNYIGGASMGGFGAIHTALVYPETFGGAFALSAALIIQNISGQPKEFADELGDYDFYQSVFGNLDIVKKSRNNPEVLVRELLEKQNSHPHLILACGTEDGFLENNRRFFQFLRECGYDKMFYEEAVGAHSWEYWNEKLEPAVLCLLNGR